MRMNGRWKCATSPHGPATTRAMIRTRRPTPLLEARAQARAEKNWALADAVRDGLAALGFTIEDTPTERGVSYGE